MLDLVGCFLKLGECFLHRRIKIGFPADSDFIDSTENLRLIFHGLEMQRPRCVEIESQHSEMIRILEK